MLANGRNAPGVQEHNLVADPGKVVLHLEVFKGDVPVDDLFQQSSQLGNVPLAVPQFINGAVFRSLLGSVKSMIKNLVGGDHLEIAVQDKQRLPHRVHNAFGEILGYIQQVLGRDVDKGEHHSVDDIITGSIG